MDLNFFRTKNDRKNKVEGSGIFEYRNLRDFEKVLFLEHQVKGLIDLLKRKNRYIVELNDQIDRVIENKEESKQVIALKSEVNSNLRIIKKWKDMYQAKCDEFENFKLDLNNINKKKS